MKKNFLAGLAILLPIALTFFVISFFVNILTRPFVELVEGTLESLGIQNLSFLFLAHTTVLMILSKILILVFIFGVLVITGLLAQGLFKNIFSRAIDYTLNKIPGINRVHKAIQEVVYILFNTKGNAYTSVVLVPYPDVTNSSIGLVSSEKMADGTSPEHMNLVTVFVPASPNPTVGFLLLYQPKDLIFIDMKVEDALRYIVSIGVMKTEFNMTISPFNKQDISAK